MPLSHMELRRLCDDIHSLGPCVHADIKRHVDPEMLTKNGNGLFFDMADLSDDQLKHIRHVVDYAKGTRVRLAEHDHEMFLNAQRLVSGPIETHSEVDETNARGAPSGLAGSTGPCEGEEAFAVQMEAGCVSKPAKGVFVKK